jgi:hypothetical protein
VTLRELKDVSRTVLNDFRALLEDFVDVGVTILDYVVYQVWSFTVAGYRVLNEFLSNPVNSMLVVWFIVLLFVLTSCNK